MTEKELESISIREIIIDVALEEFAQNGYRQLLQMLSVKRPRYQREYFIIIMELRKIYI